MRSRPSADVVRQHPILLASPAGEHADTVLWLSTRNQALILAASRMGQPGPFIETSQPFGDFPLFAWHTAREQVVLVDRPITSGTASPAYIVHVVSLAGDTLSTHRYPYDPVRLTDGMFRPVALERAAPLADDSTEALAIAAAAIHRPAWLPPVSGILTGPDGWIWIRREAVPGADRVQWDVLDPLGSRVGSFELDTAIDIRAVRALEAWAVQDAGESGMALWRIRVDDRRG